MAILFRIISNAGLAASPARQRAFTGPDERTQAFALAQCAHVDLPGKPLPPARWVEALNALLPPAIRVLRCGYVSNNFHARLSAKGKIYRYRIWSGPVLPPFEYRRAWHIARPLDLKVMKAAAKHFVGTHDFAGFAANRGKAENSTI